VEGLDLVGGKCHASVINVSVPEGRGSGYVETALCSTSSVTRSATMADTGDPMAVPKDCW